MILQEEFDKIIAAYEQYIGNGGPKNSSDKITYVNTVFNSMNMISKLLCISAGGVDVDSVVLTENQMNRRNAITNRLFHSKSTAQNDEQIETPTPDKEIEEVPVEEVESTVIVEEIPVKEEAIAESNISTIKEENTMPIKKTTTTDATTKKNSTTKKSKVATEKKTTKSASSTAAKSKTTAKKTSIAKKSTAKKTTTKKTKDRIEAEAKMKAIEEVVAGKSASDIIREELNAWGIPSNFFAYQALVELPDLVKHAPRYDEILDLISKHYNKNKATVSSALSSLVRKADISKSIYNPDLIKLTKEELTKTVVIEAIAEYCDQE